MKEKKRKGNSRNLSGRAGAALEVEVDGRAARGQLQQNHAKRIDVALGRVCLGRGGEGRGAVLLPREGGVALVFCFRRVLAMG